MRISDRELTRKIEALEASRGASVKLREEIDRLDITDHIADCFVPVHEDVDRGDHTFINLPGELYLIGDRQSDHEGSERSQLGDRDPEVCEHAPGICL